MNILESVHTVLVRKFATFSGRASRSEFWWFYLVALVIDFAVIFAMDAFAMGAIELFLTIVPFLLIVPSIAVTCRRLHDIDRSGWWQLMPLIGCAPAVIFSGAGIPGGAALFAVLAAVLSIVLIVWWAKRGDAGPNRFGPDPLERPETSPKS